MPALCFAAPVIRVLPEEQMRINLTESTVQPEGKAWDVRLVLSNDNDLPDGILPNDFRRWWHVEIGELRPEGETLNVHIENAGYRAGITPVRSDDGGTSWTRIAEHSGHSFIVHTKGTTSVRLAKWYPYGMGQFNSWLATTEGDPRVTRSTIGRSVEDRPIVLLSMTDPAVPPSGKTRIWIHSAVHPAENTTYFQCEGLVRWLLGDSAEAKELLRLAIVDLVPMANPDGVAHGNYRTNAKGVNVEVEWKAPYDSAVPEAVALRSAIEERMGTAQAPGSNPIEVLLNLHAAHSSGGPFHILHETAWPERGVAQVVRTLEDQWVGFLNARSPFARASRNDISSFSIRQYVEAMMHDRYSIPGPWKPVMAITMEGTYQKGRSAGVPCTPDDYRLFGEETGFALRDYVVWLPEGRDPEN
jgi:hypothetical protein